MNILVNGIDVLEILWEKLKFKFLFIKFQIKIKIRVIDKNYIFIYIIDNGIGILEKVKNRIFELFYIIKFIGKGMGLGLFFSY